MIFSFFVLIQKFNTVNIIDGSLTRLRLFIEVKVNGLELN